MKKLLAALKPTSADGALVILVLLLVVVLATPELLSKFFISGHFAESIPLNETVIVFVAILSLLVPAGAALGTYSNEKLSSFKWFVGGIFGCFLLLLAILYREQYLTFDKSATLTSTDILPTLGILVITFFGTWILTKTSIWLHEKYFAISKQRLLIVVALTMFAVLTIRNILGSHIQSVPAQGIHGLGQMLFIFGLCSIFFGVIPATFLIRNRSFKAFLFAIVYYPFVAAAGGYATPTIYDFTTVMLPSIALGLISFLTIMLLTTKPKNPSKRDIRWSFFGWLLALASIGLVVVALNFSLAALVTPNAGNKFEIARTIKQLSTTDGLKTRLETWRNSQTIYGHITYKEGCAPEALKPLNQGIFNVWLWHHGITPGINTSHLRNAPRRVGSILNSTVTMEQVSDICNSGTYLYLTDCKIAESVDVPARKVTLAANLELVNMGAGETAKFLNRIDTSAAISIQIRNCDSLSERDWEAILKISQECEVRVFHETPPNVIAMAAKIQRQTNLRFQSLPNDQTSDFWKLALDTSINPFPNMSDKHEDLQAFWDLAFASKADLADSLSSLQIETLGKDFELLARNFHWLFETSSGDQTGLIIPFNDDSQLPALLESASELTDLTQLSFDARWIPSFNQTVSYVIQPTAQDLSLLGNLTKLKRLDFPIGFLVDDLGFVQHLPDLEYLQIDVQNWNQNQLKTFGFVASDLKNLKSLVIFGEPSKFVAAEISKLASLAELTVVLDKATLLPTAKNRIEQRLSLDFKPIYRLEEKYHTAASPEFNQHVKRVRKELRRIHLK